MGRLLLVSNRLPVTVSHEHGAPTVAQSAGGLATGLRGPHEQGDGLWFGWPGNLDDRRRATREPIRQELAALRAVPVFLSKAEIDHYYRGFANGVLWPLFHYLLDRVPLHARDWASYRRVNERFAEAVVKQYRPGDLVWIHDFHLLLLPSLLREQIADATIGLFLHIPFPSSEVFRLLPWREDILHGMLGADLIGFHTAGYLRHFAASVIHVLGLEVEVTDLQVEDRRIRLGVFPMGVDASLLSKLADTEETRQAAQAIRAERPESRTILSVDRLDYTKGIPRRLVAFERLLENEPFLRGKVRLIQIAAPSRLEVGAYKAFRRQVDGLVGRINGRFATSGTVPIHYLMQGFTQRELAAMYRAADVMWVTPLRDGMNLVAKEFVACRNDEAGVLVLSEFAGAAAQLGEALQVNPYDVDAQASAVKRALTMPIDEQRDRMQKLRRSVLKEDVHRWAASFIETMGEVPVLRSTGGWAPPLSPRSIIEDVLRRIRSSGSLALFLDYDGTLVPFVRDPDAASPDRSLLELLESLTRRPETQVHLVSGRRRGQVEEWFGHLALGLHAEHGLWSRWRSDQEWVRSSDVGMPWKEKVLPLLEEFASRTPGTRIEEKDASLVWHYRRADPEFGSLQAKELRLHLLEMLSNVPVRILGGDKLVEVRSYEVSKGVIVSGWSERRAEGTLCVAMGDDVTDEDMFSALPEQGVAVHVGLSPTIAKVRLKDSDQARRFLTEISG